MNITDVQVIDPRLTGGYDDPWIQMTIDDVVFEQADPLFNGGFNYRVIPCGPFYAVEVKIGPDKWADISIQGAGEIGEVNKLGLVNKQLVPVLVIDSANGELELFMDVMRARRTLRRFRINDYIILVDEQAALVGELKWRLELSDPMCYGGAVPSQDACGRPPIKTLIYKDAHLPLCTEHLRRHQHRLLVARAGANH